MSEALEKVSKVLELKEVGGHENDWGRVLWIVSNIKVSVTASYVMGKC